NQLCGFELKFRRKMFTHEVTYRVGEVRISPPIRWPVSVCHYMRAAGLIGGRYRDPSRSCVG
ncbi:MAG: hypothetical protein ACR5LH_16830, partial [Sodalis sp. (in: enterobacteria)]